jgi:hypothetical protein
MLLDKLLSSNDSKSMVPIYMDYKCVVFLKLKILGTFNWKKWWLSDYLSIHFIVKFFMQM